MKQVGQFSVPENLSEITLGQFIRVQQYTGNSMKDQRKVIGILTNSTPDVIDELNVLEFVDVSEAIAEMDWSVPDEPQSKVIIDNDMFTLKAFDDLTTSEFVDFDTLLGENKAQNLDVLCAIAYDDGKEHTNYVKDTRERARLFFAKMNADVALSAIRFFVEGSQSYASSIADCSEMPEQVREMAKKIADLADGGGN